MLTVLYVLLSFVGLALAVHCFYMACYNLESALRETLFLRLAPGYEIIGSSVLYISGSIDVIKETDRLANPARYIYHPKGLNRFTRMWSFENWLFAFSIFIAFMVLRLSVGAFATHYSLSYLATFV